MQVIYNLIIMLNTELMFSMYSFHAPTCTCNYIPEKRKFPGILCFRQQRRRLRRVTILLLAR